MYLSPKFTLSYDAGPPLHEKLAKLVHGSETPRRLQ